MVILILLWIVNFVTEKYKYYLKWMLFPGIAEIFTWIEFVFNEFFQAVAVLRLSNK